MNPNSKEGSSGKRGKHGRENQTKSSKIKQNQAKSSTNRAQARRRKKGSRSFPPLTNTNTNTNGKQTPKERERESTHKEKDGTRNQFARQYVQHTRWNQLEHGMCGEEKRAGRVMRTRAFQREVGGVNDRVTDRSMIDVHFVRCTCTGNELPLLQLERKLLLLERQWLHILQ